MIQCWTILRQIGGALAAPVRHVRRHVHPLGWRPHRHIHRAAKAGIMAPVIVCKWVGEQLPPLASAFLKGALITAGGAGLGGGSVVVGAEIGGFFVPAQQPFVMGSGPQSQAANVGAFSPPTAVSTPPNEIIETPQPQPQEVPEPSSAAILGVGLGGLLLVRRFLRRSTK